MGIRLRNSQCILFSVMAGLIFLLNNGVVEARILACESFNQQPRYCRADTRGGVRLIRQISDSRCYEGDTWGYDPWGIWVTGGCRAKFEIGDYYAEPYGHRDYDDRNRPREGYQYRQTRRTIRCESWENRETYCRVPVGHARVEVERQLSDTPCQLGRNWGWNGGGIWVTRGCRAIFSIY